MRELGIAEGGGQAELNVVAGIVSHIEEEKSLLDFLAIPGDRLEAISGAIADALTDLCVERRPVEGSGGLYIVEPRPVRKVRARLFARASANEFWLRRMHAVARAY